jgi:hypothetical protein
MMRVHRSTLSHRRRSPTMIARARHISLCLAVAAALVGPAGCANLEPIRDFANISADAVRYRALVQDYVSAPEREARYAPSGHCAECDQRAAARKNQEEGLLLEQVTLQAYMDALGKLAADDVVDYSKEYGGLNSAIVKANFADQAQADALSQIAGVLTKAATDAWRQKKLRELIEGTNASVQKVIAGLQQVMQGFELEEDDEETAAASYYEGLIRISHDPAGIEAAKEWAQVRSQETGVRRDAIVAYSAVLTKIGEGHQHLYDDRNNLCSKANLEAMKTYAGELGKAYKALEDLRS